MNLANTIELEKLAQQSPKIKHNPETITFESLKNAKNTIKNQNKEYVNFIKEIEEMSSEETEKNEDERPNKKSTH